MKIKKWLSTRRWFTALLAIVLILGLAIGGFKLFRDRWKSKAETNTPTLLAMPGWPKTLGAADTHPAIADINKDGKNDIIVTALKGSVYAVKGDGNIISGFPVATQPDAIAGKTTAPAIADIDRDGFQDIVVVSYYTTQDMQAHAKLWVIKSNGQIASGWPVDIQISGIAKYSHSTPTIADINADGKLEIITKAYEGYIFAYSSAGQVLSGWPVTLTKNTSTSYPFKDTSVSVADINNDGKLEIFAGHAGSPSIGTNDVYAFKYTGEALPGWPQTITSRPEPGVVVPVGIADIDGDGQKEIVARTSKDYYPYPPHSTVNAWKPSGQLLWTKNTNDNPAAKSTFGDAAPLFVNMDSDPGFEILITTYDYIFAIEGNGSYVAGWPKPHVGFSRTDLSLADVTNDRIPELIGAADRGIHVVNQQGEVIASSDGLNQFAFETAAVGDVNGDGKVEVVANITDKSGPLEKGVTYVWKTNSSALANVSIWPQYRGDAKHSGIYRQLGN